MTEPTSDTGGSVLLPVLIAALFLAVIGGSAGLVLGLRDSDETRRNTAGRSHVPATSTTTSTTPPVPGPVGSPDPIATRPSGGDPEPDPDDGRAGAVDSCRNEIGPRSGADLRQVFYLRTAVSEVWICRDGEGELFYQGHRGGPDDRPIQAEGDNWLFLTGVVEKEGAYVAINGIGPATVTYTASPKMLEIRFSDGRVERQPAIVPADQPRGG